MIFWPHCAILACMKAPRSSFALHERQYKERGFTAQRRYPNESLLQFLAAHFFSRSPAGRMRTRILELGCGSGANLWMLAGEGFDAYGVDAARTALRLCRKMLAAWKVSAHVSRADMRTQMFPGSSFDAIVDVVSIQHTTLSEHAKIYAAVFAMLKPGGRFFSYHLGSRSSSFREARSKMLDSYTVEKVNNPRVPLSGNGPICFIPVPRLKALLKKAGFTDISLEKVTRTYKTGKIIEYLAVSAQKL